MGKIKLNKSFVEYLQYEAQKPKMLDVDSWMIGWNDAVKAIAEIVERGETDLIVRMSYKDAVPVVRCKDCKHNSLNRMSGNAYCDLGIGLFQLNDYCSLGEQNENAAKLEENDETN